MYVSLFEHYHVGLFDTGILLVYKSQSFSL